MEKGQAQLELIKRYFSDFTPRQLDQLAALDELYKEWNSRINVISRKDMEGLYEKHVLHSLSIAAVFEFRNGEEVIDIGTGGGFPGIPLAIFFPETRFHLVDSIGKKIKVVEAIRSALDLQNLTTQHIRAEEITKRKFDWAVSRAVAPLATLWGWSKPLLRKRAGEEPGGLICLKGGDLTEEIAASGLRPRLIEIHDLFPEDWFLQKFILYVPLTRG